MLSIYLPSTRAGCINRTHRLGNAEGNLPGGGRPVSDSGKAHANRVYSPKPIGQINVLSRLLAKDPRKEKRKSMILYVYIYVYI